MTTFVGAIGLLTAMLLLTIGCSIIPVPPIFSGAPTVAPANIAATPFPTKVALPAITLIPTPSSQSEARQVVADFFQAVSTSDVDGALSYWNLLQPDQPSNYAANIRKLVTGWATGKHKFAIGTISYSGLVAPGDYRALPENDSRVSRATANIRIDAADYAFSLTTGKGGWWIEGILTAGAAQPTATPR